MEELQKILKSFSELRDQYSDIQTAIEMVCVTTGLGREKVLGVLDVTGVYILPGCEEELQIKRFIASADRANPTEKELTRAVAFNFCISSREAERLVHKWFNNSVSK